MHSRSGVVRRSAARHSCKAVRGREARVDASTYIQDTAAFPDRVASPIPQAITIDVKVKQVLNNAMMKAAHAF